MRKLTSITLSLILLLSVLAFAPYMASDDQYQVRVTWNANGDPVYIGEAVPGRSPASANWRIKMCTYSGTDLIRVSWADYTAAFDKVWSLRATYTYI